jgi:hypothetical protein
MPYETIGGNHELASRLGHGTAAVRAIADQREFFVPSEALRDIDEIRKKVRTRAEIGDAGDGQRLSSALAIDGSYVVERVRDGLPSVLYGFAQAAAAYVDLNVLETQRAERFVDPYEIDRAVNTALVTLDLPVAGAYTRENVDIATSWRESIDQLFRIKKIEVNRLDQSLLELLFLLHGKPGTPAVSVPVNCPTNDCNTDVAVPAAGIECDACGTWLLPTDVLRIHEEVGEEQPGCTRPIDVSRRTARPRGSRDPAVGAVAEGPAAHGAVHRRWAARRIRTASQIAWTRSRLLPGDGWVLAWACPICLWAGEVGCHGRLRTAAGAS